MSQFKMIYLNEYLNKCIKSVIALDIDEARALAITECESNEFDLIDVLYA